MSLRLGFHYHIPMFQDTNGSLKTPGYLGRFLDSLAVHCVSLVCFMHSPRLEELPQMDYVIQSKNIELVNIGEHTSVPHRLLHSHQITKSLRNHKDSLDVLLLRGPSPLLPAMANAAKEIPTALLLVGDYLAGISELPQPRWRKEAIRLWSYWNYRQQLAVSRRALTFVNSHTLYEQYEHLVPNLVETRTTTLSQNDFFERVDTCQQRPIRLLYTGRIDRAKGLFEMVEAVWSLVQNGYDVVLDLVGWPAKGDTIVEELSKFAEKLGIAHCVTYHGFKAVGEELFTYYVQADIYVIASQKSEGFPRTIWEAMAHSLPVVATKVGSIPYYLTHQENAWLTRDTSTEAISEGIKSLIDDASLRQQLILNARVLVKENTLEIRSRDMYSKIVEWLNL